MTKPAHSGFATYPLRFAALGLLMAGPQHGYRLHRRFGEAFGLIWKAGQTKFYATLNALEDEGLITATSEPQAGRPARRVYHLADAGRDAFLGWLHQPVTAMRSVRVELMAKLRFFDLLGLPGADALIGQQVAAFEAMRAEWAQQAQADNSFTRLVNDYRARQAQFIIDWLRAYQAELEHQSDSFNEESDRS